MPGNEACFESLHYYLQPISDEHDRTQKNTFTKWINFHLATVRFLPLSFFIFLKVVLIGIATKKSNYFLIFFAYLFF